MILHASAGLPRDLHSKYHPQGDPGLSALYYFQTMQELLQIVGGLCGWVGLGGGGREFMTFWKLQSTLWMAVLS